MLSETQRQNLILVKVRLEAWIDCHAMRIMHGIDTDVVTDRNMVDNYRKLIVHLNAVLEEK